MKKTGLTYLITGSANRIGRSLAENLSKNANAVIIHYRSSSQPAEELAAKIIANGTMAFTISADLRLPADASQLVNRAWDIAGPIDVLINNASIFELSRLSDVSIDELNRNMMVNAFASLFLSRSFAELNKNRNAAPVIINLLDTHFTDYDPNRLAYHLSKRTLFSLTKMMALEFAPRIRVNAVAPGLILAPLGKGQSYLEQLKSSNPLNTIGSAGQVVDAVEFLIDSEFITGQVIFVDGGRHLIANTYG